jgi:hypothetical protein
MENQNRSLLLLAVLLRFLLLSTVAATITASHGEHPLPTSASLARRGLDMKCTCTTCQNPCGDYPSPTPPIYDYPPPPVVYSSPPPPEAIYYYSPPPPSTPYCPPPPAPVQPVCCGGGGSTGGSGYSPYVSWFSPPGELYPQDPGYHPGAASRGHAAWWLSLVVGGLVVLWR